MTLDSVANDRRHVQWANYYSLYSLTTRCISCLFSLFGSGKKKKKRLNSCVSIKHLRMNDLSSCDMKIVFSPCLFNLFSLTSAQPPDVKQFTTRIKCSSIIIALSMDELLLPYLYGWRGQCANKKYYISTLNRRVVSRVGYNSISRT